MAPNPVPSAASTADTEPPPGAECAGGHVFDKGPYPHAGQGFVAGFGHGIVDDARLRIKGGHRIEPQPLDGQPHLLALVEDKQVFLFYVIIGSHDNRF